MNAPPSPPLADILKLPDHPKPGAPLIVLLHGRGADRNDMVPLGDWMPRGAMLAFPEAPFPAAPWGYGPGAAWYRFLGGTTPEPESFVGGQELLGRYLDHLPSRLPVAPGRLVLGGFSQGGTSALAWALTHPGRVSAVIMLSGFLADHASVRATLETVRGTEFFWGHGTEDGNIPHPLGQAGRGALLAAGASLTAKDYPMGHTIVHEELGDVRQWLGAHKIGDER